MIFKGFNIKILFLSVFFSLLLIYALVWFFSGGFSFDFSDDFIAKKHEIENKTEDLPTKKIAKIPDRYELPASVWIGQTFNNCGPATAAMLLSRFDINISQEETKKDLRTNPDDKNVFAVELKDYFIEKHGLNAKLLYNGSIEKLKKLNYAGFYVITENWMRPDEDIGHVAIIRGFDDKKQVLILDDSYLGSGITFDYKQFDELQWKPFNRTYIVVFKNGDENKIREIVGDDWNNSLENSIERNKWDVNENGNDLYAWFSLGKAYFQLGQYAEAKKAFDASGEIGWPDRMLWYQIEPIETYNKIGEYQKALELSLGALQNNQSYAEAHFQAGLAYKGLGDLENYRKETDLAIALDSRLE